MKKVRKALSNKNGFSYIPVCIFTLIVVMVIAILMQYAFIYHVAREQRDEVQLLLDSYVTKEAIEYYDAFKQGNRSCDCYTAFACVDSRIGSNRLSHGGDDLLQERIRCAGCPHPCRRRNNRNCNVQKRRV